MNLSSYVALQSHVKSMFRLNNNNNCNFDLLVVVVLASLGIMSLILYQLIALSVTLFKQSVPQWRDLRGFQ